MLNCGTCSAPNTCAGGGTPNVCGCTGTGCCTSSTNTDGDCITDCNEDNDSDPWTDKNIFNGMRVRHKNQCSASGNCGENNTRAEANACMSGSIDETRNQCAGWDWNNPPDNICSSEYGFQPNWTNCDSSWQADWTGFINLTQAGQHCFRITGGNSEGCASLFFNTETNGVQTGGATACFNVAAGVYPIYWHYTMDNGSSSSMHVQYCFGGAAACTPSVVLPHRMLRISN